MIHKTNHMKSDENFCKFFGWDGIVFHEKEKFVVPMFDPAKKQKAPPSLKVPCLLGWAHLGLNQGPPDYESGALTN